jgi:hypothetical protein
MRKKVWPLVKPLLWESRRAAAARFRELQGRGRASADIRRGLPAAFSGRVETRFVRADQHVWGSCPAAGDDVEVHVNQDANDMDLLDIAAAESYRHGGTVHHVPAVEMPTADWGAAVLRFPG